MTVVKIYKEPENEGLILDEEQLAEYHGLTERLGLSISTEPLKCPNVYQAINSSIEKQLRALCPRGCAITEYTRSTIPFEVLKVYEFAKNNEMFHEYEVWWDDKALDPFLIGFNYANNKDQLEKRKWSGTYYLIARWGDETLEIKQLLDLSYSKIKTAILDKVAEMSLTLEHIKKNPDVYVRKYINKDLPYVSISPEF